MGISFKIFLGDGTPAPATITFESPNTLERLRAGETFSTIQTEGWYNQIQRWTHAPRFTVDMALRLVDNASIAKARGIAEMIRRGFSFAVNLNTDELETATQQGNLEAGDDIVRVDVAEPLTVGRFYRMTSADQYHVPATGASLEVSWPGYVQEHVFKITANLGINVFREYQIDPPVEVGFRGGPVLPFIRGHRYYTNCMMMSDRFTESWEGARFFWLWNLSFMEQQPPRLANPAW